MFTHEFQLIILYFSAALIISFGLYAVYCRRKAKSFIGTGRLTDIDIWAMKSTVMWIVTFVLAFAMTTQLILS